MTEENKSLKNVKASTYLKRAFRKAKLAKGNENLSFKKFVRKLADSGDDVAKSWYVHRSPRFNDEAKAMRKKNKGPRIALEKAATKLSRRKKSQGKGGKSAPAADPKADAKIKV